jgi:hypothetical protein
MLAAGNAKPALLVMAAGRSIIVAQKHSAAGRLARGASREKSLARGKSQPGERTAAQIRFENEQSHERIRQIDKMGRPHPAAQGDNADIRPPTGNPNR